ncbi:hypothetical protein LOTGIDRAFT_237137 [Lottia gigantea]|uniref:VWFC domain-containing protein n=1 Tax=Lottia gigantea TaxID=225164 RepID=V3YVX3_LOTGI|nr:hypothetical protein LOTGIDRAFT_237137 [Lottia gigantea]ESO82153.1 hypothetical protein LOTGIDRAFT_237137 [Lottia gigantea]
MKVFIFVFVFCMVCIYNVQAFGECSAGLTKGNRCELNRPDGSVDLKVNETRVFKNTCEECVCLNKYWICCRLGYKDTYEKQPGCFKKIYDNCCYQYFHLSDDNVPCAQKQCLEDY